jgi:hypothetical protein
MFAPFTIRDARRGASSGANGSLRGVERRKNDVSGDGPVAGRVGGRAGPNKPFTVRIGDEPSPVTSESHTIDIIIRMEKAAE